jgi:hypothetical protein
MYAVVQSLCCGTRTLGAPRQPAMFRQSGLGNGNPKALFVLAMGLKGIKSPTSQNPLQSLSIPLNHYGFGIKRTWPKPGKPIFFLLHDGNSSSTWPSSRYYLPVQRYKYRYSCSCSRVSDRTDSSFPSVPPVAPPVRSDPVRPWFWARASERTAPAGPA